MESYKNSALFKKGRIGSMTVKNRIVLPPMTVNFTGLNGEVTEKVLKYYEARAKGGYGMIITEAIRVNEEHGVLLPRQLRATSSSYKQGDKMNKAAGKWFLPLCRAKTAGSAAEKYVA